MRLNQWTVRATDSPIGTAYTLLDHRAKKRDLLDLAQAAPQYPTAPQVLEQVIATARHPHGGDYTEIDGLPHLREAFAAELSTAYRGRVRSEHVVVTAGCNQAFCLVASALAAPGDEVVVTLPYYFNHDMWLRMTGIVPVYLEPGPDLVPTPEAAEALINERTRAILLVTPGNPTGVTVAPDRIAALAEVAARHDVALILDETYRSFRDTEEPAHALFTDPRWLRTVVSLHSFSKEFAIPGYRVGAVVASPELGREVTKLLDCVAICAPRIGQEAAWAGLTAAQEWRRERAREIADQRQWFATVMADRPGGFELLSAGGFFGWVRHPFAGRPTEDVVRELAIEYDTLVIPGTAFLPDDRGAFRVSLSNADRAALSDLATRLTDFTGRSHRGTTGNPAGEDLYHDAMADSDASGAAPPWEPPLAGTEAEHLAGALDRLRSTFRWKADGLDPAGLRVRVGASSLTLGGLLKHLARVEEQCFATKLSGTPLGAPWDAADWKTDPDWDFTSAADDTPAQLYALWDATVARSRATFDAALLDGGLDQLVHLTWPDGRQASLRRIVCDLIEEYGRHTGQADILREAVDGRVGEDPPAAWHTL